ncbi:hypothetical protein KKA85_12535 [bacterium]|nr:hypothetical protein [bacterium]MBU1676592.1 hypothetical protein [bacterium]
MHGWKTHLLLIAIIATPLSALADCPNFYEVASDQGKAWLGMSAGGFIAGEGQSFYLECPCQLVSVTFEVVLDGLTWYGVPPLGTGDLLYCEFKTDTGVTLLSLSKALDFDVGRDWITFDFRADNFVLLPGDYMVVCFTASSRQGRLAYHQADDIYAAGVRYISENGGAGPWTPAAPTHGDLAFRVNVMGSVPTESVAWGQVKALYR